MLRIENVCKKLNDFQLKDISFELEEGYIMGLVGPNGSGKTTLIKIIMGLLRSDKGSVNMFSKIFTSDEVDLKEDIGFVYDKLEFYNYLSVKQYKKVVSKFYKRFNMQTFERYLQEFNIREKMKLETLSKGEAMKLMIATALSHEAKLLIMDEPTAGLDPVVRKEILDILQEFIEDGKKSVLFSTHITSDLDGIADYLTFIKNGEMIFSKDMESLKESYRIIKGSKEELEELKVEFINIKKYNYYYEGLALVGADFSLEIGEVPSIEEIMYHYSKGEGNV